MSVDALRYVWHAVTSFVCLYALTSWFSDINGGRGDPPSFLIDDRKGMAVLFGLFVCSIGGVVSLWLARLYSCRSTHEGWAGGVPTLPLLTLDPTKRDSRVVQGVVLAALVAVPLLLQIHFINQFLKRPAYDRLNCVAVSLFKNDIPPNQLFFGTSNNQFRYGEGDSDENKCKNRAAAGVTFFPFYEPILLILLETGYFIAATLYASDLIYREMSSSISLE